MAGTWYLHTLGELSLAPAERPSDPVLSNAKALAVLAYLARVPGYEATRDHLSQLLWPDMGGSRARRSLRQALYYLSEKAEGGLIASKGDSLRLVDDRLDVDLWRFDRALSEKDWLGVLACYEGPFLDGYARECGREFETWVESENERVWTGLKAACYEAIREAIEADELDRAVEVGRAYVDLNPLDESAQQALIHTLLAAGQKVEAYRQYETYRALLRNELEVAPGQELREKLAPIEERLFQDPHDYRDGLKEEGSAPELEESGTGGHGSGLELEAVRDVRETGSKWLRFGWVAGLVGIIVVFGLAVSTGWVTVTVPAVKGNAAGWAGATGELPAIVRTEDGTRIAVISVEDGAAKLAPTAVEPRVLLSPSGRWEAHHVKTLRGPDIHVVTSDNKQLATRVGEPADEGALAWSPDGQRLLYSSSERFDEDLGYRRRLHVLDVSSGERSSLPVPPLSETRQEAVWSPRGPFIAYSGQEDGEVNPEVFVVGVHGRPLTNVSQHPGWDGEPAWSPRGRWIAFASRRSGSADIFLVQPDGNGLERITFSPGHERSPMWLSPNHLAFVMGREEGSSGSVHVLNINTRESRELAVPPGIDRLLPNRQRSVSDAQMIDRVRIANVPDTVVPGQVVDLDVKVVSRGGEILTDDRLPVRWSVSDSQVAKLTGDHSRMHVRSTGSSRLSITVAGWRGDTVRVVSEPVRERYPELLFGEDWADGIPRDRWFTVGEPIPVVREVSGSDGPAYAMLNNGDANYDSGVLYREAIGWKGRGLTVEFQSRMPFKGGPWEGLSVMFTGSGPDDSPSTWPRSANPEMELRLKGPGGDPSTSLRESGDVHVLPDPEQPEEWRRYALQIEPDGHVSWVEGDQIRWRSVKSLASSLPDRVFLFLGGRSVTAEIELGQVHVWQGVRFNGP